MPRRNGRVERVIIGLFLVGCAVATARGETPAETPAAGNGWLEATSQQAVKDQAAEEAAATYPPGLLMDGLGAIHARGPLDAAGIRVYGWSETSITGLTTNGQQQIFGRVFDFFRANNLQENQLRLTVDRPYDTAKAFDWGGRFDLLYGSDAHVTKNSFANAHEYAILENVGEGDGSDWLDFTQAYGQVWFKTGADSGLETTVGKWVTPIGAEVIDATGNALYSHSYLFGYAIPFTHTGVKLNYIWNKQISTYYAIVNGWDTFEDNNHAHSHMVGTAISGTEQIGGHARDTVYFNAMTGPEETDNTHDFRTVLDSTYTHWWTEKLSQSLNGDWGTEEHANPETGGRANWYGTAHYLTYVFCDEVSGTWRSEWFQDDSGARIGVPGNYLENTWGLTLTPWTKHPVLKNLSLRPEVRWDHAQEPVFGDDHDDMTLAMDLIFKF